MSSNQSRTSRRNGQSASRPTRAKAPLDQRLAALERLVSEQAAQLAHQQAVIEAQGQRLAALDATHPPANATPAPEGAAPERRSRRTVLKLGGMAAAASAAALAGAATELARPGVAHAMGVPWATGTVPADELTHVVANATFSSTAVLDVTVSANSGAAPAHPLTNPNSAAIAAYDTTVGGAIGLYGDSINGTGVVGRGDNQFGVNGISASHAGVIGLSNSGPGVAGSSATGLGASFMGGLAPLLLSPGVAVGAPTTGTHARGEIYVDSGATLWVCVTAGTAGTWARLTAVQSGTTGGAVHLLSAPIRIFDTRPGFGAPLPSMKGTLGGSTTTIIQVTGTDVGGIHVPSGATAVIGNLTVTNT
ncbi:MAG TPA: hypothetical protein VGR57_13140, partial [Ktedonobacterales bacterium]|nr:hypothetical protein [Ktedonobacterales bacterium]